jgi:Putative redox-active protein (C_GCAxxG_C_C)
MINNLKKMDKEIKSEIGVVPGDINRREFLTKCLGCTAGLAMMTIPGLSYGTAILDYNVKIEDAKKVFMNKGTCSQTMMYLLNREYGHNNELEEKAADPLAGGVMQLGFQCGMIWGAVMAAGAEAHRRYDDKNLAIYQSIKASQSIYGKFVRKNETADCSEITNIDWNKKFSILKGIFKAGNCLKLADRMASKLYEASEESLCSNQESETIQITNCASLVAEKMGADNKQQAMLAGFSGGIGLSGNACGALSAAIYMNTLNWLKSNPEKSTMFNKYGEHTLKVFEQETGSKYLCSEICGKTFNSIEEHSEFVSNGGCKKLLDTLENTKNFTA